MSMLRVTNITDFIPKYQQSLVYSYKVTKENSSENIGVLSLCFKFKNEMKVIFNNLINKNNKECLTILDKEWICNSN